MGSSCVRRKLRRFCLTAIKSASRHWWSGPVPLGNGRTLKAVHGAEKSFGSKPRTRRGLRKGKKRVRGDKPRTLLPKRQTPGTDNISSRSFRKFETQFDHWEKRLGEFRRRFSPTMDRWNKERGESPDGDYSFDMECYRVWRNRFNTLQTHIRRSNLASRFLAVTWSFYLHKEFGWTQGGQPSLADDLRSMFIGLVTPGIPVRPVNTTTDPVRRARGGRKNTSVASLAKNKCPHGRSLLTCPSCGKGSLAVRDGPVCDCPLSFPTSRGLCVNCSRIVPR